MRQKSMIEKQLTTADELDDVVPPRDPNDDDEEEDQDGDGDPEDELDPAVIKEPDE
jgi:hypothetical protein